MVRKYKDWFIITDHLNASVSTVTLFCCDNKTLVAGLSSISRAAWKPTIQETFGKYRCLTRSFNSDWVNRVGFSQSSPDGLKRSVSSSSSVEAGELRSVPSISGSSVNTGGGISSLCATGRMVDGIFGYCRYCLFFFLKPFTLTRQRYHSSKWLVGSL